MARRSEEVEDQTSNASPRTGQGDRKVSVDSVGEKKADDTRWIARQLNETYGPKPWRRHLPPVDELIATILSQHTSDSNTERAFAGLKSEFPNWTAVIEAEPEAVVEAIKSGGLANQKAPRIQAALASVLARYGSFDLDRLALLSVAEARAELTQIHGVGPKTASCVLLFSLGMPAMPVDTHVFRVTRRLGIIDQRTTADQAHAILESQLSGTRDETYAFHMHLIRHGRSVCTARTPHCDRCSLREWCQYDQSIAASTPK